MGFAIGFAVKDTLSNIIGGIILTLDNSFAVGDKVNIDGDVGVVKEVGLRNTQLLTYDNEVIIIPNGELMNKKFKNFALPNPEIRVAVDFGVAYGSDVELVEKTALEAVRGVGDAKEEPAPEVIFLSMGDFSLNFQARFWIPHVRQPAHEKSRGHEEDLPCPQRRRDIDTVPDAHGIP